MGRSLWELDAREQARLVRAREISVRELVAAHLERLERVNPAINAVVTVVGERAEEEAAAADRALAAGADVGPLYGLPVAHKDTHDTGGVRTTYGSPLFRDHVPERDELVIERIRAAGAIMIGKTNVPEFAAGSHTFNPVFGLTRNPHDPDRSAGGSSGGAAAALATGIVPLAEGSDMGGSLRNPASFCGVVGMRPSPGRVPSWPDDSAWSTMSVQGPLARTVADAALLLSAIAGPDPRSPIAIEEPGTRFAEPLDRDLTGLRVAWAPDLGGQIRVDADVTDALRGVPGVFAELGCTVEEDAPDLSGADDVFRTLRAWLFEMGMGELLDAHPDAIKPSLAANIALGRDLTGPDLARAERRHAEIFHRMRGFFARYDVLALPVSQVAPFPADREYPAEVAGEPCEDYLDWMRSAYLITTTGCPAISVPAARTAGGLPVGVQLVAAHHADRALLEIAHGFERAVGPLPGPVLDV